MTPQDNNDSTPLLATTGRGGRSGGSTGGDNSNGSDGNDGNDHSNGDSNNAAYELDIDSTEEGEDGSGRGPDGGAAVDDVPDIDIDTTEDQEDNDDDDDEEDEEGGDVLGRDDDPLGRFGYDSDQDADLEGGSHSDEDSMCVKTAGGETTRTDDTAMLAAQPGSAHGGNTAHNPAKRSLSASSDADASGNDFGEEDNVPSSDGTLPVASKVCLHSYPICPE